jgi:hypothetical protein
MSALDMDQLQPNIHGVKDSLAWYQLQAQLETNRLLEILTNGNKQETEIIKVTDYSNMKRPEMMKRMGKMKAPQGWQKWSNDKMIEYLKGEQK